jgi:hypothetical protein
MRGAPIPGRRYQSTAGTIDSSDDDWSGPATRGAKPGAEAKSKLAKAAAEKPE